MTIKENNSSTVEKKTGSSIKYLPECIFAIIAAVMIEAIKLFWHIKIPIHITLYIIYLILFIAEMILIIRTKFKIQIINHIGLSFLIIFIMLVINYFNKVLFDVLLDDINYKISLKDDAGWWILTFTLIVFIANHSLITIKLIQINKNLRKRIYKLTNRQI
ncbi:MAG: hypothetical protein Q8N88_01190 [Nanoarchaeota archaeon]|nr:hypothetical protein [Nanoarchaeota archaeon]